MYSYTYLGLINRVLEDFGEVQLTGTTFSSIGGSGTFQANMLDYVNDAILDICTFEDVDWPFLYQKQTFQTVIGQGTYIPPINVLYVDWNSFEQVRVQIPVTSLTVSGGVATCTVAAGHTLVTTINGIATVDSVIVQGVTNDTNYNGQYTPNIISPTVFTYSCAATTPTATGTSITIIPPPQQEFITSKDYGEYLRDIHNIDVNGSLQTTTNYAPPLYVIRSPDNNIMVSPFPDRIYTISYDSHLNPVTYGLVNASDVPIVPSVFRQVIVDRASIYALAFRDNDAQIVRNDKRFDDSCNRMRRILVKQNDFVTFRY